MSRHPAAHDLGQHLQTQIGDVIARQIGIAQHVLEPADLTIMMVEAAVSICLTTAATSAASVADLSKTEEFFDFTLKSIFDLARADRQRSISAVIAKRAERERGR